MLKRCVIRGWISTGDKKVEGEAMELRGWTKQERVTDITIPLRSGIDRAKKSKLIFCRKSNLCMKHCRAIKSFLRMGRLSDNHFGTDESSNEPPPPLAGRTLTNRRWFVPRGICEAATFKSLSAATTWNPNFALKWTEILPYCARTYTPARNIFDGSFNSTYQVMVQ